MRGRSNGQKPDTPYSRLVRITYYELNTPLRVKSREREKKGEREGVDGGGVEWWRKGRCMIIVVELCRDDAECSRRFPIRLRKDTAQHLPDYVGGGRG